MQFDDSKWPIIIATAPPVFGPSAIESLRKAFEAYFRRSERYALIFDTRPVVQLPDARCRRGLFEWVNDPAVRLDTSRFCVGGALVVASQLARYGITVVNWIWKAPNPQTAVPTMGEAVTWCCRKLEDANVPLGPRLTELLAPVRRSG